MGSRIAYLDYVDMGAVSISRAPTFAGRKSQRSDVMSVLIKTTSTGDRGSYPLGQGCVARLRETLEREHRVIVTCSCWRRPRSTCRCWVRGFLTVFVDTALKPQLSRAPLPLEEYWLR